jgi:hypothetical protein
MGVGSVKRVIEIYTCDMCGAEFERYSDGSRRTPIICDATYKTFPVHEHNPAYDEGYQDGIAWTNIDLCPDCADRACAIHEEWYKDDDGKWHAEFSWRDAR